MIIVKHSTSAGLYMRDVKGLGDPNTVTIFVVS